MRVNSMIQMYQDRIIIKIQILALKFVDEVNV
jgi:hypothetical protein